MLLIDYAYTLVYLPLSLFCCGQGGGVYRECIRYTLLVHMDPHTATPIPETSLENKVTPPVNNIYPFLRKMLFGITILLFTVVILFLIYQNGKSIYDNGL